MVGRTILHYEILEKVGRGGSGIVYKARDLRLKRLVALKFLTLHAREDQGQIARFEREAQAIAALQHPSIATIHDVGEVDGEKFLVLEYLPGGTLREKVRALRSAGRSLPIEEILQYGVEVAEGLNYAHSKGIIHRDIKTGNLMLTAQGKVRITDFGLADLSDQEHITRAGQTLGTLAYMSPEQASGEPVDGRSDIFSLGVALYELTTGELPFHPSTEQNVRNSILNKPPIPMDRFRPDVPDELKLIILKALEKNRDRRYQRAGDLADALGELKEKLGYRGSTGRRIENASTETLPIEALKPLRVGMSRRRLGAWIVVACVLAALGLSWFLYRPFAQWMHLLPREKSVAVLPFENVAGDAASQAFGEGLMETLVSKLTQLEGDQGSLMVVPSSDVRKEKITSARDARRAFGVNLVVTGSVQRSSTGIRLIANLVDTRSLHQLNSRIINFSEENSAQMQDGIVEEIARLLELEIRPHAKSLLAKGDTAVPGAYDFYLQGNGYLHHYGSLADIDHAIEEFDQALKLDQKYALVYAGLGEAYWRKYQLTADRQWIDKAWEACRRAEKLNDGLAPVHTTLAWLYSGTGQNDQAIAESRKALQIDPSNRDAFATLATAYESSGKLTEAERTYKQAIALRPNYWNGYMLLGRFYWRQSRYSEAELPFQRVVQLTPDNPVGYTNLGGLYHMMGREEKAEQFLKKSLELKPTTVAYSNLATVYFFEGRYAEAVPIMEQVVQTSNKNYVVLGNLGDAYRWTPGNSEKARQAYSKAVKLAEEVLKVNPRDAVALSSLGMYWAKMGEGAKAIEVAEKARQLARANTNILFNAAITFELAGKRSQALSALDAAVKGGYSLREIEHEPDLRELRKQYSIPTAKIQ